MITIDNEIMAKVVDYINSNVDDLPQPVSLKELSVKKIPALFAKQMGAKTLNETVGGSYDVEYPIGIYYRTTAHSEKDVLKASAILDNKIASTLVANSKNGILPTLSENQTALAFEIAMLSTIISSNDDGTLDYQLLVNFYYHQDFTWG